jgi:hypothetical protein
MEKLIERAAARIKTMTDQMESTLKGIRYRGDMAAKNVIKLVKGILNGHSRP